MREGRKEAMVSQGKINPGFYPGLAGAVTGYPGYLLATAPAPLMSSKFGLASGLYSPRDPGFIRLRWDLKGEERFSKGRPKSYSWG